MNHILCTFHLFVLRDLELIILRFSITSVSKQFSIVPYMYYRCLLTFYYYLLPNRVEES
jgi:hypothetical protein